MALRVILAGFGWWGQHLLPRLRSEPDFEVVGICAPELSETSLDGTPCFHDFDSALDACDADAAMHGPLVDAILADFLPRARHTKSELQAAGEKEGQGTRPCSRSARSCCARSGTSPRTSCR